MAYARVINVTASNLSVWGIYYDNAGSSAFVNGPATPPLGPGSLQVSTGANLATPSPLYGTVGGKVYLQTNSLVGQSLSNLTNLSYSTYSPDSLAPYVTITVNAFGGSTRDTTLVFDPANQGLSTPVVNDTWQTWNALSSNAQWYCETGSEAPSICQGDTSSGFFNLSTFLQEYPNTEIVEWYPPGPYTYESQTGYVGGGDFAIVVGDAAGDPGWVNESFYIDNVTIGTETNTQIFGYERGRVIYTPSGIVKVINVSITNPASSPITSGYVYNLTFTNIPANYADCFNGNVSNWEVFNTINGDVYNATLINGATNSTSSSTSIILFKAEFPVAASSTAVNAVALGCSAMSDTLTTGAKTGKIANLTSIYGSLDNMANVVQFYTNFSGNSLNTLEWGVAWYPNKTDPKDPTDSPLIVSNMLQLYSVNQGNDYLNRQVWAYTNASVPDTVNQLMIGETEVVRSGNPIDFFGFSNSDTGAINETTSTPITTESFGYGFGSGCCQAIAEGGGSNTGRITPRITPSGSFGTGIQQFVWQPGLEEGWMYGNYDDRSNATSTNATYDSLHPFISSYQGQLQVKWIAGMYGPPQGMVPQITLGPEQTVNAIYT